MEINLWNVDYKDGRNIRKTRNVISYIENMKAIPERWMAEEKIIFDTLRKKALQHMTADEMLETIGYKYQRQDGIFDKVEELAMKKNSK